jgi:glycerophosphoryl diester phosphodiesterase
MNLRILLTAPPLLCAVLVSGRETMVVAHRGASKDAPENTLPAFKLAFEQGADAIEGDFHLTKDGHVVCVHDSDTRRVSGTNLRVSSSTLTELRALDVGASRDKSFEGTRIPTIAEVFSTVPDGKRIYIEIKSGAEIISPLLEEIRKSGLKSEQIVVICFDSSVLAQLKQKAPELKVSWLCSVKKGKTGAATPSIDQILSRLRSIKADAISTDTGIPEEYIETIKTQGYQWHVWTVDNDKTARKMKALGTQSITTNVPGRMRQYLAE